jgi:hypothetical protein
MVIDYYNYLIIHSILKIYECLGAYYYIKKMYITYVFYYYNFIDQ